MGNKEGKSERKERQQAADTLRCYDHFQGPLFSKLFTFRPRCWCCMENPHSTGAWRSVALPCAQGIPSDFKHSPGASKLHRDGQSHHLEKLLLLQRRELHDPDTGTSPRARPGRGEELGKQSTQKKNFSSVSFYSQVTIRVEGTIIHQ